jgi:hypothetical protein
MKQPKRSHFYLTADPLLREKHPRPQREGVRAISAVKKGAQTLMERVTLSYYLKILRKTCDNLKDDERRKTKEIGRDDESLLSSECNI